jgi:hypothetical protein
MWVNAWRLPLDLLEEELKSRVEKQQIHRTRTHHTNFVPRKNEGKEREVKQKMGVCLAFVWHSDTSFKPRGMEPIKFQSGNSLKTFPWENLTPSCGMDRLAQGGPRLLKSTISNKRRTHFHIIPDFHPQILLWVFVFPWQKKLKKIIAPPISKQQEWNEGLRGNNRTKTSNQ